MKLYGWHVIKVHMHIKVGVPILLEIKCTVYTITIKPLKGLYNSFKLNTLKYICKTKKTVQNKKKMEKKKIGVFSCEDRYLFPLSFLVILTDTFRRRLVWDKWQNQHFGARRTTRRDRCAENLDIQMTLTSRCPTININQRQANPLKLALSSGFYEDEEMRRDPFSWKSTDVSSK